MSLKVSIITTTYNSAATVRDTLQSVANQTYKNIEHIIIDGLSSDDTLHIVAKYPHVEKIISEKDKGIYDAMNKGVFHATGDIIAILNSDDFYANNEVIEKVVKRMSSESCDGLYADLNYVEANNTTKVLRKWKSGNHTKKSFYYGWMPPHPTIFIKKSIYEQYGAYNLVMKSSADYEFILRTFVSKNCKFIYLPETIVLMRAGGISNASFKNRWRANKEDRLAWKMNNLKPFFFTLYLKPLRKIFQFIK